MACWHICLLARLSCRLPLSLWSVDLYSFFFIIIILLLWKSAVHSQSRRYNFVRFTCTSCTGATVPVQKSVGLGTSGRISIHLPEVHCHNFCCTGLYRMQSMWVCIRICWHRGYYATANQRRTREMTEAFLMTKYKGTRVSAPSIALY